MGSYGARAAAAAFVLLLAWSVSAAQSENAVFEVGNIVVHDEGGISPQRLPRHASAPISASLNARVETKDGTRPPAARSLVIDFDRTIEVDVQGLPSCAKSQLIARSTAAARHACSAAIVGEGSGDVEVEFPEQPAFGAKGKLLAFNGGTRGGRTLLFIHTYVNVPAPTAVVVEVVLTHRPHGHFDLHSVTTIPEIAGGAASVTAFQLHLGRSFTYKGKRRSFLAASCPSGHYFVQGHAFFSDGTVVAVRHVLPCTPER